MLADDHDRRRRYGSAARESVAARTWAAVGDELIDHYGAVIAADRPITTVGRMLVPSR
jgi:phosphatidylinositol alpha 1,6-mannosyltransferase